MAKITVGVHALTEFVFCPRAGLIAQQSEEDEDDERPLSRRKVDLDSPVLYFDERAIYRTYKALARELGAWFLSLAATLAIVVVLGFTGWVEIGAYQDWVAIGTGAVAVFSAWKVATLLRQCVTLGIRHMRFKAARPADIPDRFDELFVTDWRRLLRAGYQLGTPEDVLVDHRVGIAGKPWKVLGFQRQWIPVFRMRLSRDPGRMRKQKSRRWIARGQEAKIKARVRKQHWVRMAGYCRAIEAATDLQAPFGILLFDGSYDVAVLPNNTAARGTLRKELDKARAVIADYRAGREPPPPRGANRRMTRAPILSFFSRGEDPKLPCIKCPYGFPRVVRWDEPRRDGLNVSPYPEEGEDGRPYHSSCGDLFGWVPPHARAFEKGLRR